MSSSFHRLFSELKYKLDTLSPLYNQFLSNVENISSSQVETCNIEESILSIAKLLRMWPEDLRQLNVLFQPYRLEFDCTQRSISLVVLKNQHCSRIETLGHYKTFPKDLNRLSSLELRDILKQGSSDPRYEHIHRTSDPTIQGCLSQLAQDLLDQPNTCREDRRVLLQYLHFHGGLPPSLVIHNIRNVDNFATTFASDLYRGTHSGQAVVIKRPRLIPDYSDKKILRDVTMWRQMQHSNILSIIGVSLEHSSDTRILHGLITPYMQHGNIVDFLKRDDAHDINRLTAIWQVTKGLQFLHAQDIPHRGIKPGNILVDDRLVCQLTDFGLSFSSDILHKYHVPNPIHVLSYMAPEVQTAETGIDNIKVDIFALGNTFCEIFHGSPINHIRYYGLPREKMKEELLKPVSCLHPPDQFFWDIVYMMLDFDPSGRPSIDIIRMALEDNFSFPYEMTILKKESASCDESLDVQKMSLAGAKIARTIARRWAKKERKNLQQGKTKASLDSYHTGGSPGRSTGTLDMSPHTSQPRTARLWVTSLQSHSPSANPYTPPDTPLASPLEIHHPRPQLDRLYRIPLLVNPDLEFDHPTTSPGRMGLGDVGSDNLRTSVSPLPTPPQAEKSLVRAV